MCITEADFALAYLCDARESALRKSGNRLDVRNEWPLNCSEQARVIKGHHHLAGMRRAMGSGRFRWPGIAKDVIAILRNERSPIWQFWRWREVRALNLMLHDLYSWATSFGLNLHFPRKTQKSCSLSRRVYLVFCPENLCIQANTVLQQVQQNGFSKVGVLCRFKRVQFFLI